MSESKAQPARDFFELFSFNRQYEIDLVELKKRYRTLQLKFHPDQYSADASSEKMAAVKMSSLLNDAFEVLSNPVKRARYLLEIYGINLQTDRSIDPTILLEQIDFREQFEEISSNENLEKKEIQLEALLESLSILFQDCIHQFTVVAKKNLEDTDILKTLKQLLSRMLFLNKLIIEVTHSIEALE